MKIVVCAKVVPDAQSVTVDQNGNLDLAKAKWKISDYDLQALEAGRQLADETGAQCIALTVGPTKVNTPALKKDILSRGPSELYFVADDELAYADTRQTVEVLAAAVKRIEADIVICGEGSADRYAQATGVQLGQKLGFATANYINSIAIEGDALKVERALESATEVLKMPLPAAISVTAGINTPAIPSMKAILAGGKKPQTQLEVNDLTATTPAAALKTERICAPAEPDRKKVVLSGTVDEAVAGLVSQLKQEGLI